MGEGEAQGEGLYAHYTPTCAGTRAYSLVGIRPRCVSRLTGGLAEGAVQGEAWVGEEETQGEVRVMGGLGKGETQGELCVIGGFGGRGLVGLDVTMRVCPGGLKKNKPLGQVMYVDVIGGGIDRPGLDGKQASRRARGAPREVVHANVVIIVREDEPTGPGGAGAVHAQEEPHGPYNPTEESRRGRGLVCACVATREDGASAEESRKGRG